MNDLNMKEVTYQQCLYEEITGDKPTKEKCDFNCSAETCEYCIETTMNDLIHEGNYELTKHNRQETNL